MPSQRPGLASVPIDGEMVVIDEAAAKLHHLDALATRVWTSLDGQTALRETCLALSDAFSAALPQVEADVRALVERLTADGLLTADQTVPEITDLPLQ